MMRSPGQRFTAALDRDRQLEVFGAGNVLENLARGIKPVDPTLEVIPALHGSKREIRPFWRCENCAHANRVGGQPGRHVGTERNRS